MSADRDPYKVLGVDHAADPDVVMTAYRALARLYHPDVSRDADAERHMAEINAAWTILRDPDRRAAYDREHGITDGLPGGRAPSPIASLRRDGPAPADAPGTPAAAAEAPAPGPGSARGATSPSGGVSGARAAAPPPTPGGRVAWRRGPNGEGAAGPPPGRPRGTVLPFGRHIGWSIGEVARVDPGYLQWLVARPEGAPYKAEIDAVLAPMLRTADGRGFMNPASRDLEVGKPKRRRFRG